MAATIHEQIEEFCRDHGCDLAAEHLPELGTWFVRLDFHDAKIPRFVSRRGDTFGQAVSAALAQAKAEAEERPARRAPE